MKKTIIYSITFDVVRSTATFYVTDYLSLVLCAPKFSQITSDPKLGSLTGQPFGAVAMVGNDKHLQSTKKKIFVQLDFKKGAITLLNKMLYPFLFLAAGF